MSSDQAIYSALSNTSDSSHRTESIVEIAWRRRGLVVIVLFLTVMAAALTLIVIPKRIAAEGRVLIVRNTPAEATESELRTFLNTQAQLIKSAPVLSPAIEGPKMDEAAFFQNAENPVNLLKDQLEVTPLPDSSVLKIRLFTTEQEESKQIVQNVMTAYVAHVAAQKKNVAIDAYEKIAADRGQLENQRIDFKKMLIRLEAETRSFTSESGASANLAVQKLRELSNALTKSQLETAQLKSQFDESLKPFGWKSENYDSAKLDGATAVSAQSLGMLQSNLAALSQQLIEAKRQFIPTHPAVRTIQAQIRDLQLSQSATLRSLLASAQASEQQTRNLVTQQQEIVQNIDAKAAEKESVSSRITMLDKQIAVLDDQLSRLQLSENVGFTASEIEEPAIDEKSVVPNTWKTLSAATVVGLVLGLMSALLREWASPSLGSIHRIADTVGVPVLGTLPRVQGEPANIVATLTHAKTHSPAAEAFRSIRTSMLFGAGRCNTITVTSPAPKDGKTTLAANLAISLAQSGKRVALVDANFREPALHVIFNMDNAIGFTGVLTGDDLESSLRRTPIEHMDVLTSGPKSLDVSEQLNSTQFTDLLRDLNLRYDYVIFDTSSVSGSNDARVIAAGCDQTILVVRGERSNRFATTTARDALLSVGATLMGIVVNDSQSAQQAYPPAGDRRDPTPERAAEPANRLRAGR